MLRLLANLVTGNQNEREMRRLRGMAEAINALEDPVSRLSEAELQAKTAEFRGRLERGETLEGILNEAFAVVREVAKRTLSMRHFDVQLMGGIVLHEGNIAEMKTGEGKTLVATLPAYLNALPGEGVHIVTVNDYLARRDAEWMGAIYSFLGLDVGVVVHGLDYKERKNAYLGGVTYGTNNQFGFDYLRDNMALHISQVVQGPLNYAIVDEVDSILIDEARTPLIISGPSAKPPDYYYRCDKTVRQLREGRDYEVDEKGRAVPLTEEGQRRIEQYLGMPGLYGSDEAVEEADGVEQDKVSFQTCISNALRAHCLMKRDRDYVVKDGQVIIVDEFTGRLMFGRRYSNGLHQAIEAKEGVKIEQETQTVATITFQNYFRMYRKLAGMTGTAVTEEEELRQIYGLDVAVIPPNKPLNRAGYPDVVFPAERAKFRAVVEEICERHEKGQPVLVGTVSIEKSEILSDMLKKRGVPHQVLNAKHHEKEAEIIKNAGQAGTVTIATNMAGRGTDIVLGEGVTGLGGLHIIGTERHEARRIDDQLRGRSGRQGDPGSSRFYISLEDDLMRLFGSDLIQGLFDRLNIDENEPIEHSLLTRAIERAQKRVESRNFDIRKRVLEYDNVMNRQREVIYEQRRQVLHGENLKDRMIAMMDVVIKESLDNYAGGHVHHEDWDLAGLARAVEATFPRDTRLDPSILGGLGRDRLVGVIKDWAVAAYDKKEAEIGPETMRELERQVTLRVVDSKWMDHLDAMDDLREGISLRAYGHKDPFLEYQIEAHATFEEMIRSIQVTVVTLLFRARLTSQPQAPRPMMEGGRGDSRPQPKRASGPSTGRNAPCPCGSGKKYKKCCGKTA
ncbi:MAG: preprotein translocase subunit SecA [Bacillota bacterium]